MSKTLLAALAAAALSPVAAAAQTMSHDHDMAMPERGNDTQADESMSEMTMPGMTMPDSGYTPGSGTARLPADEGMMQGVMTDAGDWRSEEHTSELQSLMRISYAVFCLKKKTHQTKQHNKK